MNIGTIRTALATALTMDGLRVSKSPPDLVNPPHAVIWGPDPVVYSETWDAGHHLTFTVRVLAARASERAGQDKLDQFMQDGVGGIYRALEANKTLSGAVASAQVMSAHNMGGVTVNDVEYLSVDFTVDVMV